MKTIDLKQLLHDLFEEEALMFGGLVAAHLIDDAFVWRLVQGLDAIRTKMLRRIESSDVEEAENTPTTHSPHPAIEEFLLKLRRGANHAN